MHNICYLVASHRRVLFGSVTLENILQVLDVHTWFSLFPIRISFLVQIVSHVNTLVQSGLSFVSVQFFLVQFVFQA